MEVFMAVQPSALLSPFATEATCIDNVPTQGYDLKSKIFTGSPQSNSAPLQNSTNRVAHHVTLPEIFAGIAGLDSRQARTILAAFEVINPGIRQQLVSALEQRVAQTEADQT
jgi:spore coat protein CotF